MASEIEIEVQTSTTCTAPDTNKNNDYIRFSRRAGSNTTVNGSSSSFQGAGNNNHVGSVDNFTAAATIPNPSQTNNYSTMLPSSTTNLTSMTSGGGGFLSCVTPPNLSPAAQPQHQINTTPAAVSVSENDPAEAASETGTVSEKSVDEPAETTAYESEGIISYSRTST